MMMMTTVLDLCCTPVALFVLQLIFLGDSGERAELIRAFVSKIYHVNEKEWRLFLQRWGFDLFPCCKTEKDKLHNDALDRHKSVMQSYLSRSVSKSATLSPLYFLFAVARVPFSSGVSRYM